MMKNAVAHQLNQQHILDLKRLQEVEQNKLILDVVCNKVVDGGCNNLIK